MWCLIKLDQPEEIEEMLPPSRCVWVGIDDYAYAHAKELVTKFRLFEVTPDMIESEAYIVGKEYEFSNVGKVWIPGRYSGYSFETGYHYTFKGLFYRYVKPLSPEPVSEIDQVIQEMKEIIKRYDTATRSDSE